MSRALAQKPKSATIFYRRGLAYYKNKQFDKAIRDLYSALEHGPSEMIEADIYYHLGISYANL